MNEYEPTYTFRVTVPHTEEAKITVKAIWDFVMNPANDVQNFTWTVDGEFDGDQYLDVYEFSSNVDFEKILDEVHGC